MTSYKMYLRIFRSSATHLCDLDFSSELNAVSHTETPNFSMHNLGTMFAPSAPCLQYFRLLKSLFRHFVPFLSDFAFSSIDKRSLKAALQTKISDFNDLTHSFKTIAKIQENIL